VEQEAGRFAAAFALPEADFAAPFALPAADFAAPFALPAADLVAAFALPAADLVAAFALPAADLAAPLALPAHWASDALAGGPVGESADTAPGAKSRAPERRAEARILRVVVMSQPVTAQTSDATGSCCSAATAPTLPPGRTRTRTCAADLGRRNRMFVNDVRTRTRTEQGRLPGNAGLASCAARRRGHPRHGEEDGAVRYWVNGCGSPQPSGWYTLDELLAEVFITDARQRSAKRT
jgi:hypothetical protein